jgi:DNA invertase Pin-like site-specific DNA recombinase
LRETWKETQIQSKPLLRLRLRVSSRPWPAPKMIQKNQSAAKRDKGQEGENQLAQLREFGAKQGWAISCEHADRESGANRDRIEFQEMFRDAADRRFDLLLFWSLDRFTGEGVLGTLTHPNRLTGAGVGYRSFTEPYFDSCGIFKDAVISILATIAKQERIRLSERVYKPAWRAPAVGESGSAGQKKDRGRTKNCPFALTGPLSGAKSRSCHAFHPPESQRHAHQAADISAVEKGLLCGPRIFRNRQFLY